MTGQLLALNPSLQAVGAQLVVPGPGDLWLNGDGPNPSASGPQTWLSCSSWNSSWHPTCPKGLEPHGGWLKGAKALASWRVWRSHVELGIWDVCSLLPLALQYQQKLKIQ